MSNNDLHDKNVIITTSYRGVYYGRLVWKRGQECLLADARMVLYWGVRFDVPGHLQGQIVEIAYGGFDCGEHGEGDPYQRVTDRSAHGAVSYFKRVDGPPRLRMGGPP